MTFAETIVLTVVQAETAAAGMCRYEGLGERLAAYLDEAEIESFLAAAEADNLEDAFCYSVPVFAGIYLGIYGFRYGERASEMWIRV